MRIQMNFIRIAIQVANDAQTLNTQHTEDPQHCCKVDTKKKQN